jgi:deoxycytidine triphosphate deaminase
MLINPNYAIEQGWIKNIVDPKKQIQPNAIDFTLDKLFGIDENTMFVLSEKSKKMRENFDMELIGYHGEQMWNLQPNKVYDGMSNMYVEVPEGVAVKLIIRSTLNRNGIFLTSGLYDSGFKGNIGFAIHNRSGHAMIAPGTRIGQIEFYKSDSSGLYAGGYNTKDGQHYKEKDN